MQLLRRRPAVPAGSVSPLLDTRSAQRVCRPQARRHTRVGDAPDDGGVPVPALAFFRRLTSGVFARGLSRQWYPPALGQYELGVGSVSALGRVSAVAGGPCRHAADAQAEVPDISHAGWQTCAAVLLSFAAHARRAR